MFVVGVDSAFTVDRFSVSTVLVKPKDDVRYLVDLWAVKGIRADAAAAIIAKRVMSPPLVGKTLVIVEANGGGEVVWQKIAELLPGVVWKVYARGGVGMKFDDETRHATVSKEYLINTFRDVVLAGRLWIPDPKIYPEFEILCEEMRTFRYQQGGEAVFFGARSKAHDDTIMSTAYSVFWSLRSGIDAMDNAERPSVYGGRKIFAGLPRVE